MKSFRLHPAVPNGAVYELVKLFGEERIRLDPLTRLAYARDASSYRLEPFAVVYPKDISEIQQLFAICRRWQIPVTFRGAGTSLSGQAIGYGCIVDIRPFWKSLTIHNAGNIVQIAPGTYGGEVNRALRPYRRRIGPDPASIDYCTMGGILANNASGMRCRLSENAYHSLRSVVVVLANGTVLDTEDPDGERVIAEQLPEIRDFFIAIRRKLRENGAYRKLIDEKYQIRNTTGYMLKSFFDFDTCASILAHLMIGSEGTLGFIAEAKLQTVPIREPVLTAFLVFSTVADAVAAVPNFRHATAVEFLDTMSLKAGRKFLEGEGIIVDYDRGEVALLVEFCKDEMLDAAEQQRILVKYLRQIPGVVQLHLAPDPGKAARLWNLRKGLYPIVGGTRPLGTSVIIEDIVFPQRVLAPAITDLQALLARFGYNDAIIFGHIMEGNLHFVLSQDFSDHKEIERYDQFMRALVHLVAGKYGGSLKGEHGTGRNIAPFLADEWGEEIAAIMEAIKEVFDPEGILNPSVIISGSVDEHIRNLKKSPAVDPTIDRCTECGFCESICPSRYATVTPRQRIQIAREVAAVTDRQRRKLYPHILYAVQNTCAADHLCSLQCPLHIDVGSYVLQLRQERLRMLDSVGSRLLASAFPLLEVFARWGLSAVQYGEQMRKIVRRSQQPSLVSIFHPVRSSLLHHGVEHAFSDSNPTFLPSCLTRIASLQKSIASPVHILRQLSEMSGKKYSIITRKGICCGLIFDSYGLTTAGERIRSSSIERLRKHLVKKGATAALPQFIVDQSSCARHWQEKTAEISVSDFLDIAPSLLGGKSTYPPDRSVAIHLSCGRIMQQKSVEDRSFFQSLGIVHFIEQCCGMAGARGIFYPEISDSALRDVELPADVQVIYTTNMSCGGALARHFAVPVRWIGELFLQLLLPSQYDACFIE